MIRKKILVVDDEEDILRVIERRLSGAGYAVITATNGQDAITLAKKDHPDLIVLDIVMPDMDGGDVAYVLENDHRTKDIPIIFLTALLSIKEEKSKKEIAGKSFLAKPYNPEDLIKTIQKLL